MLAKQVTRRLPPVWARVDGRASDPTDDGGDDGAHYKSILIEQVHIADAAIAGSRQARLGICKGTYDELFFVVGARPSCCTVAIQRAAALRIRMTEQPGNQNAKRPAVPNMKSKRYANGMERNSAN